MMLWLTIFAMAGLTFCQRASFLLLQNGVPSVALGNERLLAGLVAIGVAWRWRVTFGTILAGLAALHLFDWMF